MVRWRFWLGFGLGVLVGVLVGGGILPFWDGGIVALKDAQVNRLKLELAETREDVAVLRRVLAVVGCESGGRHEGVWGDNGKSYGVAQFQRRTFYWLRQKANMPQLRWTDRADQLTLLEWAVKNGYGDQWACYEGK